MPTLGVSELLVIFMILLLVFGASRLPALGEGLGRTVRNFKRGSAQDEKIAVHKDAPAQKGPADAPDAKDATGAQDADIVDPKA